MNGVVVLGIAICSAALATIIVVVALAFIHSFFEDHEMSVEFHDENEVERLKEAGL